MINRRGFISMAAMGSIGALAACSTGSSGSKESTAASGGPEVKIKHAFGETVVKGTPKRVVCVGWGEADVVAALGLTPVAAPAITWGGNAGKSTDWFDAQLKKIGGKAPERFSDTDGTPVDKVASYQPDLIIGTNSGLTKDQYEKLSKIAPTIAYKKVAYGTSWEDSTAMIATALGKAEEGKKLVSETKQKIESAVAKHPELKGKTASWIYFTPTNLNSVGIYTPADARPHMLSAFGLSDGSSVKKLTADSDKFFVDLSAEKASQIDSQVVVFDQLQGAEPEKVKSNSLLGKIPALKSDAYVSVSDLQASSAMSIPSVLSIPVALETFLPQLVAAAKKVK